MKLRPLLLRVSSIPFHAPATHTTTNNENKTLILLVKLASLLALPATAQVNYAVSEGTAYVTRSPFASGDIVIASTYNGYPVTRIEAGSFYMCRGLTNVTIPDSILDIENGYHVGDPDEVPIGAFAGCGLTGVTGGNSITNIGNYAFYGDGNLTNVTMRDRVARIGDRAFDGCTGLTSVTIPNSVAGIGSGAFQNCHSLTSVTIGNRVTSIGDGAFGQCFSLTSVSIPNSVTDIGGRAFSDCKNLTSVSIGNSVTTIGLYAFAGCSLTSVTIPDSVTLVEFGFSGCSSLTNLSVDAANPAYSSLDGVLFDNAQKALIQFPGGRGGSYVVPNSVTSIGLSAFSDCPSLMSVTIPNSVISIGEQAFHGCFSLTNLTLLGDAPLLDGFSLGSVGTGAAVYYYCGTTGWEPTYGGLPTVMLLVPRIDTGNTGVKPGGFSFTLSCFTNQTIVVEASTNLLNWQPIWTNTLSDTSAEFVDPQWLDHSHRFYRAVAY